MVISISFFLSANQIIAEKGFSIPDSVLDPVIKMVQPPSLTQSQLDLSNLPISQRDIEELKKNPALLQQFGLSTNDLDALTNSAKPTNLGTDLIKKTINDQIQNIIDPIKNYIPMILGFILFFSLTSLTSILSLLLHPLIYLLFLILEKTGYIHFTEETRPVKKMVV